MGSKPIFNLKKKKRHFSLKFYNYTNMYYVNPYYMSKLICAYGAYEGIIMNYDNQIDNKVCL